MVSVPTDADELKENKQLTEWTVRDLNADPTLPYEVSSFSFNSCLSWFQNDGSACNLTSSYTH